MSNSFQQVLDHIRSVAVSKMDQGRRFERLMKTYFGKDPLYKERFSDVWLWAEWATGQLNFDGADTGIDLIAKERNGGYCAIQCKCYGPNTRISKPDLDSFISASARDPFTARIVVDTGDGWGPNAYKTINELKPACHVLRFGDLASRPFDWPDLESGRPEDLIYRSEPFLLRPHQQTALNDVIRGFKERARGKLIMACGTGKTFVALRIAESMAGIGGRVLYLVPSISLLSQSIREWSEQKKINHSYVGICSDTRTGNDDEDALLQELEIPVTTDPQKINLELNKTKADKMTVVFCTYHSLALIEQAQDNGAPPFDLILCDEAHRTTGIERPGDNTSPFQLVHDEKRIRAAKRLYMTATPRIYTPNTQKKAARHDVEVFSMDKETTYGPEFHHLPFSQAVEQDLLSDFKIVVLALSEEYVDEVLQKHLATGDSEINITDATKIVGCWQALQNPENKSQENARIRPLTCAIAFTDTIASSKRLAKHWNGIINNAIKTLPPEKHPAPLSCETQHVDGQNNALERRARIEWLKEDSENVCRILSNARCLSEGVDVPALDAVLFLSKKKSQVDIVQAVGRTMRKAEGKEYGYIILPIVVPAGVNGEEALTSSKWASSFYDVVSALRSHDERFNAEINQIDLNEKRTDRIIIFGDNDGGEEQTDLQFPPLNIPPDAIYAKIVEKCGDIRYWETWAKDVADIFTRLVQRIEGLLKASDNVTLRERFDTFHKELKLSTNDAISHANTVEMLAQHILTNPVFEALFEGYNFAAANPVAQSLDALRRDFDEFGLENEIRDLENFYESVRRRAKGLDSSAGRQKVLMQLYEKFFATAMKKDAQRLGIVYTPTEVVDFIIHSADHVLREEFDRGLTDKDTHILDPFTGTGIFLVRLLQSTLIRDTDLDRKYHEELHANELVLLAYYIAAIHIEEAFHGRCGAQDAYQPFNGIVLTDTFNLHTDRTGFPKDWLTNNSERVERQQNMPIQVILGNPPWSTGQRSAADDNPNVNYPEMKQRIQDTFTARSITTNKNSLYDSYKMAIRWASDRIGDQGIVTFVSNGSWIDGNVDSGVRACLAEEFNTIYVLNLRGNQRTQGERSRREGGKVFGQGSRAPVAIMVLVRNPDATHKGCRILYRDIGDYLKREEKLKFLDKVKSIAGIHDWREITPNRHHDWINQRNEDFQQFYPLGSKEVKAGKGGETLFRLFSNGYNTGRDAYLYNFSREACADNARLASNDYIKATKVAEAHPEYSLEEIVDDHSTNIRWDRELKNNLKRQRKITYSTEKVLKTQYRPFVKQYCYVEYVLAQMKYQMNAIFPISNGNNQAICVPGKDSNQPFSVLAVNSMPNRHFISACQCFPRYHYSKPNTDQISLAGLEDNLERFDNITNAALNKFRIRYRDQSITKDDIFNYVYGVLHAPSYREYYANDLDKELPRIPLAPDFSAFTEAGKRLMALHLNYETCDEYPLEVTFSGESSLKPEHYRITHRKIHYPRDPAKSELIINDHISLVGIPPQAHQYQVNGRTPLEWLIDRYKIKKDPNSGINNDPNTWFDEPQDLITTFRRIVHLSVETAHIVGKLPGIGIDN